MKFLLAFLFAALLCAGGTGLKAQVLLDENFNYPAGDTIGSYGWVGYSGGSTNAIKAVTPGLTFSGYPLSGIGNTAYMLSSGQDSYKGFTGQTTGSIYISFMMRIDTIRSGDYFFSMLPSTSTSNLTPRVFVRSATGGFNIGISKSTETTTYSSTVYTTGTTYLVVLKYIINAGTNDDQMGLYVFPSSYPSTEPGTLDVGPVSSTAVNDNVLSRIVLRQGTASSAPSLAIDGIRVSTAWSVAPPSAPTLSTPANGSTGISLTPTLDWNDVSGAASYTVQVATDAGFTNIIVNQSGLTSSQYAVTSGLSNNTQYYWRVSATNAGGTSSYSSAFSFTTIVAAPVAPTLSTPANGSTGVSLTPTLDWNDVSGAASYTVQVATDAGFSNIVINPSGLTSSQYSISSGLSNNTQYFWRVSAANAGGTSSYSSAFSFTTIVAAPVAPTLSTPANGSTGVSLTPTLDWNDVSGAASYTVQVATDAGFSNIVINQSGLTSSQYSISSGLSNNTQYFWRVSAANAGGTSSYSSAFSFTTIVAAPAAPSLLLPADNAMNVSITPTFDWTDVTDERGGPSVTYRIQVAFDSAFTNIRKDTSGLESSQYTYNGTLANGTVYYWRVQATNAGGTGAFSQKFKFTTVVSVPGAPVLSSPLNGASNVIVNPLLDWNDLSGAVSYRLQLSTDSLFGSTVKDTSGLTGSQYQVPAGLLSLGTKYYWRVSGNNAGGPGPFSGSFSFTTTAGLPVAPVLLTPVNDSNGVNPDLARFVWRKAGENFGDNTISKYMFVLYADTTQSPIRLDSNLTDTTANVSLLSGLTNYYWKVRARNENGWGPFSNYFKFKTSFTVGISGNGIIPKEYALYQNYPNPFNPSTKIKFDIPKLSNVKLTVYNSLGKEMAVLVNDELAPGVYEADWNASSLASGIYFYRIQAGEFTRTYRMVLVK